MEKTKTKTKEKEKEKEGNKAFNFEDALRQNELVQEMTDRLMTGDGDKRSVRDFSDLRSRSRMSMRGVPR